MHILMWEPEKSSSTSMGRSRSSPSNQRSSSAHKSKLSTRKRNLRKSQRSHLSHPLKPSLNSWKAYRLRRRRNKLSLTTTEMRDEESNVRSFWNRRRKRSKQRPQLRKCGERKCHRQGLHPATTTEPKVQRVPLWTQNLSPRHEVHGKYPSLHCI